MKRITLFIEIKTRIQGRGGYGGDYSPGKIKIEAINCPVCHGEFKPESSEMVECENCHRQYSVKDYLTTYPDVLRIHRIKSHNSKE